MKRTAVYAGTFDPVTNGHLDIIRRAAGVFSEVHVAIGTGLEKQGLFSAEERKQLVEEALADIGLNISVHIFDGLLVEFARTLGASVIIRGLRAVSDYDYEAQISLMNRQLAEEIETVFLMASENCSFISSSIVKDVAKNGGDVRGLVPGNVVESLKKAYQANK